MKASDAIINFFENKGIDDIFCISGGGCIHIIDSLRKSKITTTCMHHEQSLLMAAEGYTRLTNKMCASVVTTGPGGTNAITGLLGMWMDSIPSIIISGQVAKSQLSRGTGCRQIGDQEYNIIDSIRSMTKYSVMVENPEDVLYELEKAYQISNSGRPGPVWIDVPLDVQGAEVQEYKKYTFKQPEPEIDIKKINKVKKLLLESSKPLVIAGNGVRLSSCYDKLGSFLSKNNIPVVTGPHSGVDVVDNTYEYYCGRIGVLGQQTSNEIVQSADLLICLGTRLPVKMTGYNIKEFSPKSKKIYVDIDKNEIDKHKFDIDVKINSDLNLFFDNIAEIGSLNTQEWLKYVKNLRSCQSYYHKKHQDITEYASFYYFIDKAPEYFKQVPIVTSNGTAHVVTLQMYRLNRNQRLFTNVGCASMGYGLPASIGACIGNSRKQVICIEGDGSIMMNLQELETVSSNDLPIKIIVINNAGYLSIRLTQDSFFDGALHASSNETGVTLPSMKKISSAFNLPYYKIKTNADINSTMSKAFSQCGPALIEIFTHPMERHEPKVTHRGHDQDGKIIPGSLTDMKTTETY